MKYKTLGRSSLRVSELWLGAMNFGEELGTGDSREVSKKIYEAYRAAGGTYIATANVSHVGQSETVASCLS